MPFQELVEYTILIVLLPIATSCFPVISVREAVITRWSLCLPIQYHFTESAVKTVPWETKPAPGQFWRKHNATICVTKPTEHGCQWFDEYRSNSWTIRSWIGIPCRRNSTPHGYFIKKFQGRVTGCCPSRDPWISAQRSTTKKESFSSWSWRGCQAVPARGASPELNAELAIEVNRVRLATQPRHFSKSPEKHTGKQ